MARKRKETTTQRWLRLLTHPGVVVYILPALMLLLVAGTVAQRYVGLYRSEQMFFSSFILCVGIIPLPGAYTLLGALSLSLLAKILLMSPWKREQAGIIITHMGALLLLAGGLLTSLTAEEGYIMLKQGEQTTSIADYHDRELAIYKNGTPVYHLPFAELHEGQRVAPEGVPFTLHLDTVCRNCLPARWQEDSVARHGLAEEFTLTSVPPESEDEENRTGAVFQLFGAGTADGHYVALETAPRQPEFSLGDDRYRIVMQKIMRPLPFSVRLDSFAKSIHPGTEIARGYESTITLHDGELAWPVTIRMNYPLRYRGYTLYQSAFVTTEEGESSVLAVVKNSGRVFPYVSSLVMCVGLLTHLYLRRRRGK